MKSDRDTAPGCDELEISIFGPGYGECIVVHYGGGNWFVIDSCVDNKKLPIALSYLQRLGVNPADNVKLVAATHWHDDHVRGLASVVEKCISAQFCCSAALRSRDFINLSEVYSSAPMDMPSGPREFNTIFKILKDRPIDKYRPIKWSQNDQVLLRETLSIHGEAIPVVLNSLSPSDEMLTRAAKEIAQYYESVNSGKMVGRLVPHHPNHVSVAMNLTVGKRSILLGSDLENTGDALTGWAAICSSQTRSQEKSLAYKVAHHASASGHYDSVWSEMLDSRPMSFITPFRRGPHKIPTKDDQAQILALTDQAYITADPQSSRAPKKRPPKIEATIRAATLERKRSIDSVGQIRWRVSISDETDKGSIMLYDGAYKIE